VIGALQFCGAHALPWAGTMDCGDVDDLARYAELFFRSEELKAVRGGALHNGTCGYVADDSDDTLIQNVCPDELRSRVMAVYATMSWACSRSDR